MLDVSSDQGAFARSIRLVLADRQPIVLQGLRSVFAAQHDFEIVASCSTGTSCLEAIRNLAPDVALLADTLLDLTASEILAIAQAEHLPTRLVFFTESETDNDLVAAIAAGDCSAISKYANPDTLLRSLRLMTERIGVSPEQPQNPVPNGKGIDGARIEKMLGLLTQRETQIVQLVSEGLSNKEIARQLNVSQGTVKVHLHNIFQKLEISNRTVLATIALLQRPAGFGTLSLAALALAILDDVKASAANNPFLDEHSAAHEDPEHPILEVWKKAILRHTIVVDPGETVGHGQRGFPLKLSQAKNPPPRIEPMHAVEQTALSSAGRGHGPIGSGAPCLFVSPLLQGINNSQAGSPTAQQSLPPPAFVSGPIRSHGGYGAFTMTAAGWVSTLDNANAAVQPQNAAEALIDASALAGMERATQGATIAIHGPSDAAPTEVDGPASGPVAHAPHLPLAFVTPGHESTGETIHAATSDALLTGAGSADVVCAGSANDPIKGGENDTGNGGNDTVNGGHGADRLAGSNGDDAFAYRSANDSNSTQFNTIVDFTSGTDKINLATLGALAFLHLTSTSASVPPHTLAWIYDSTSNETIIYVNATDRSLDIGDPGLMEIHLQGAVSVTESDFVYKPDAAAVTAALKGIDPAPLLAIAGDGIDLAGGADIEAKAGESTLSMAGIWTMPADDGLRFHFGRDRIGSAASSRLTSFGDDAPYATEASEDRALTVPAYISSIEPAQSHASVLAKENLAFNNEPAHANSGTVTNSHDKANGAAALEPFEFGMQSAAIATPAPVANPNVAPGDGAGHGNAPPASQSAAANASAAAELAEPDVPSGSGLGYGNAQHASNSAAAKASAAAEPTDPGVTPGQGKSASPSHAASARAMGGAAEPVEFSAAPGNSAGHGNAPHASQAAAANASAATELAEPGITLGNNFGHGNAQHAPKSALAKASAAAEPTEPGLTPGHSNSVFPSHSASASKVGAPEPTEPGSSHGNSAHGNSQHASLSAAAKASAAAQPPEAASGTAGTGGEPAFHFNNQDAPSTPGATVELGELNNSSVLPGHAELAATLEPGPAVMEEHAASHVNNGQHHAMAHSPPELLI